MASVFAHLGGASQQKHTVYDLIKQHEVMQLKLRVLYDEIDDGEERARKTDAMYSEMGDVEDNIFECPLTVVDEATAALIFIKRWFWDEGCEIPDEAQEAFARAVGIFETQAHQPREDALALPSGVAADSAPKSA